MGKKPKGARGEAWGILNPYGDLWTFETFKTEAAAQDYVRSYWKGTKDMDLSRFKPIRVKVHVTALSTPTTKPRSAE